ncbi:MAG: cytochrome c2 [Polyangiales bacterium]|jgi:cytochrome c2
MSPHQLALSLSFCLLSACSAVHEPPQKEAPADDISTPSQVREGLALIAHFECARCHQGVGEVSAIKDCTGCHQEILHGEFDAAPSIVAGWQERLSVSDNALVDTLDLRRARHFRRDWIAGFLTNPRDLRPALGPMMPRLAISDEQAAVIARALVPVEEELERIDGDAERGEALVHQGRCGQCHLRDGEALPGHEQATAESSRRAPDLAYIDRWQSTHLLRWLMDPQAMDPDTLMPQTGFSLADAQDVAAFLLPTTAGDSPALRTNEESARLPLLGRDVFHEEVETRIFRRLCWHCHGDPDYARSEGGPGNTGGFGFAPRRLDLSSYEGVMSGAIDEEGHRYSVLFNEGMPRIVEALVARHREVENPAEHGGVRGMPLGMPPLSFEDIRLVESWIAQGARR